MSLPGAPDHASFDPQRFLDAQATTYPRALAEIRAGDKRTHWMWFVFPQIAGLGQSEMSRRFALSGRAAATAYLAHPVLGERLRECVAALLELQGRTAHQVFGYPDDLKLHSSLTLFAQVSTDPGNLFEQGLARYFEGQLDQATLRLLRS